MTTFDYAVLAIVGISILISVLRGLVREVLALLAWVAAFATATLVGADVGAMMPRAIPTEELRLLTGFLGVLLVMSLAAMTISRLVKGAGLGFEDRMFGMLFGLARGALIVLVLVLLSGLTPLPRDPMWRNAMLSSPLESLAVYVKAWLPGDLSRRIKYD